MLKLLTVTPRIQRVEYKNSVSLRTMPDCQRVDPVLQRQDVPFCSGCGGSVTIATRPWNALPNNRGSILHRTKKFISFQSIQTGSGTYTASYSICLGLVPRGCKAVWSFKMTGAVPPLYHIS